MSQKIDLKFVLAAAAFSLLLSLNACKENSISPVSNRPSPMTTTISSGYEVTYLVADTAGFGGARIDPQLVNAWGISVSPNGTFWLSDNGSGLSSVYDQNGNQRLPAVQIPSRTDVSGGVPTGIIFNGTSDFALPSGSSGRFIFAGEDGIIAAWGGGSAAIRVAKSSQPQATYKGLAMASSGGQNYLYATDFRNARIDIYDKNYMQKESNMLFKDNAMPEGYAPFGIANIGGMLYVSYAKHIMPGKHDDEAGPGHGYIDVFTPEGKLVKRFASAGSLNSPWGITQAPNGFGGASGAILIGNFGDGSINAFDTNGGFLGQLADANGHVLMIEGLWGITPFDGKLYFAAGPGDESHGSFGYVQVQ